MCVAIQSRIRSVIIILSSTDVQCRSGCRLRLCPLKPDSPRRLAGGSPNTYVH